ncbi:unnamed protein product [Rhizoctonia solani]|uniref:CCL2-like lectin domain-containing protein n=1 Tax=Rhizoctonia solani TaxID=456999 RepID=A0A8H3DKL2_9AGAM|nr:unnamed protein product [Rhizoctonia solani]
MPEPEYHPISGTYIIYNRVQNSGGQRLALTFNGDGQAITATPVQADLLTQQWVVQRYGPDTSGGSVYELKPVNNQGLETGQSSNGTVITLPARGYVFSIYRDETGYLIKNGHRQNPWSLRSATNASQIIFTSDSTDEKQRWHFHLVTDGAI